MTQDSMRRFFNSGGIPGMPGSEYLPLERIEQWAEEMFKQFAKRLGREPDYPLEAEVLVREVLGLDVHYDSEGMLDDINPSLLACLYPDGTPSPIAGRDRLIVVNCAPRYRSVTAAFSILHEAGHYLFHFPRDAVATSPSEGHYCRNDVIVYVPTRMKVPPREWQASRFASELLMPKKKVSWLLDGKQPGAGEVINLDIYGGRLREFFDVSQAAMEKRLSDLGYKYAFGRYEYANVTQIPPRHRGGYR